MQFTILVTLLSISFLHGVFASGIIPILNFYIQDNSGIPFSTYFFGIIIGQSLIIYHKKFSNDPKLYVLYETLFGCSLILLGVSRTLVGFTICRFIEGLFAGVSLPLMFKLIILSPAIKEISKKIALFNSIFALGIVLGPSYVTYFNSFLSFSNILFFNGTLFIIVNAFLYLNIKNLELFKNHTDFMIFEIPLIEFVKQKSKNIKSYQTLFYAKFFYGFLLSATASYFYKYFPNNIPIQKFLLLVSLFFVIGQIIFVSFLKFFSRDYINIYSPLCAAVALLLFGIYHHIAFLFLGVIFHASLLLVGQLNIGEKPEKIRDFALFNLITDPGMLLGSFLANLKFSGIIVFFLFSFFPLIKSIFARNSKRVK